MDNLICQSVAPVEMPVGLTHLSDLCWCDPIVEVDFAWIWDLSTFGSLISYSASERAKFSSAMGNRHWG
jgi:hypothetical protein